MCHNHAIVIQNGTLILPPALFPSNMEYRYIILGYNLTINLVKFALDSVSKNIMIDFFLLELKEVPCFFETKVLENFKKLI